MHPAWVARQNLTRTLDGVLTGFLEDAGAIPTTLAANGKPKPKSKAVRTEGAWIGCRGGSAYAAKLQDHSSSARNVYAAEAATGEEDGDGEEEDEEIWWAWEGKIVGFADW